MAKNKLNTKIDLVRTLNKVLRDFEKRNFVVNLFEKKRLEKIKQLIDECREGKYHDFESPIALPKVSLNRALIEVALFEIAKDVRAGVYDEKGSKGLTYDVNGTKKLRPEVIRATLPKDMSKAEKDRIMKNIKSANERKK